MPFLCPLHALDFVDFLKVAADGMEVLDVVDVEVDSAVENTVLAIDGEIGRASCRERV